MRIPNVKIFVNTQQIVVDHYKYNFNIEPYYYLYLFILPYDKECGS